MAKKKNLVTNDCKLTPAAVQLWNSSSQGVSTDTKAVAGSATTATPVGESTVEFGDAIKNKLQWDEYNNTIKEKLLAIKTWDKETFGD